jgi:hypothetical protein
LIVAVLAFVCAGSTVARARRLGAPAASSSVVVVTNTLDVVNGNVSSIGALNAKPGRDGISLREALEAANHTRGTQTVYIMFSAHLNGKTIEPRSELPPINRDHLVLEGIAPSGSLARVTIDGRRAPSDTTDELLLVKASEVTVRWLRFTGLHQQGNGTGRMNAVVVRAGRAAGEFPSPGPRAVANVQIEDDVFDNRGNPDTGPGASGVIVSNCCGAGVNTSFSDITIERNTFVAYMGDDAVGVWADDSGLRMDGIVIEDNTFGEDLYSIELSEGGTAPSQSGIQIVGNTIVGGVPNAIGISLNATDAIDATRNGTVIDDNTISGIEGSAINIGAELFSPNMLGFPNASYGDLVSNTQIVNNVIRAGQVSDAGIYVDGGDRTGTSPSSVSGLTIENDTLVDDTGGNLLSLIPNQQGVSGNTITGVAIRNTILWDPNGTPITTGLVDSGIYVQPPDVVTNSLISGPGWAGSNANVNANPEFVNGPAGEYRLAAGSPAINAGTTVGAPAYDILGAPRRSPPDIGAYEYGAVPRPLLAITLEQLAGSGSVTSTPAGISCETTCIAPFDPGTTVTLTAKPAPRSRFLGWAGACSGKRRCTVILSRATSLTARFGPK